MAEGALTFTAEQLVKKVEFRQDGEVVLKGTDIESIALRRCLLPG
jgi:hypothetical protein